MLSWFPFIKLMVFLFTGVGLALANDIGNHSLQVNQTEECNPVSPEIIPTCLINRKRPDNAQQMIEGDSKVCTCLNSQKSVLSFIVGGYQDEAIIDKRKKLLELEAQKTGNLSYLQAAQYAKDKRSLDIMAMVYSGQETRANLSKQDGTSATTPRPSLSDAISTINEIDSKSASWQCVTYQEYSVQREIPSDNKFFKLLKDTKTLEPDDWNPSKLETKINTTKGEEQELIILKLSFLSRNPIFNAIMKAVPSDKISKEKLLAKQKMLFNIFEKLRPAESSTCHTIPNKCWNEIHESGAFTQYTNQVASFVLDNDVIDITSSQTSQDFQSSVARINNEENPMSPTDPEAYFNSLQTTENDIANNCSGPGSKAECYLFFNKHCSQITKINARLKKELNRSMNDVTQNLRQESSIHALLNPADNPEFRSFNDKICLQAYTNANGEALNFFQYQEKQCSGSSRNPHCSDRKKLLNQFLAEHNTGGEPADLNLRSGFIGVLGNAEYLTLSNVQIAVANNISESPRELRERFGGLFPSISPAGQLLTFSPVTGNAKSAASSSGNSEASSDTSTSPSSSSASGSVGSNSLSNNAYSTSSNKSPSVAALPEINDNNVLTDNDDVARSSLSTPRSFKTNDEPNDYPEDEKSPSDQLTDTQIPLTGGDGNRSIATPTLARMTGTGGGNPKPRSLTASQSETRVAATSPTLARLSKKNSVRASSSSGITNKALLSKYGLEQEIPVNSDVKIIPISDSSEVILELASNKLGIIKTNPQSLELNDEALAKINENPDEEVMLVIESKDGKENVILYAKKEDTGGVTLSITPGTPGRSPASQKQKVRINVTSVAYDEIDKNGDKYFNKNDVLLNELDTKDSFPVILQVVSPGKKSVSYEVNKVNDMRFSFKRR